MNPIIVGQEMPEMNDCEDCVVSMPIWPASWAMGSRECLCERTFATDGYVPKKRMLSFLSLPWLPPC